MISTGLVGDTGRRGRRAADSDPPQATVELNAAVAGDTIKNRVQETVEALVSGDAALTASLAEMAKTELGVDGFAPSFTIDKTKLPCGAGLYRVFHTDGRGSTCEACGDPSYYCPLSQESLRIKATEGAACADSGDDEGCGYYTIGEECGSIDVICPFDPAGRTESIPVDIGYCSVPVKLGDELLETAR